MCSGGGSVFYEKVLGWIVVEAEEAARMTCALALPVCCSHLHQHYVTFPMRMFGVSVIRDRGMDTKEASWNGDMGSLTLMGCAGGWSVSRLSCSTGPMVANTVQE